MIYVCLQGRTTRKDGARALASNMSEAAGGMTTEFAASEEVRVCRVRHRQSQGATLSSTVPQSPARGSVVFKIVGERAEGQRPHRPSNWTKQWRMLSRKPVPIALAAEILT